jgi:hypothetical protein
MFPNREIQSFFDLSYSYSQSRKWEYYTENGVDKARYAEPESNPENWNREPYASQQLRVFGISQDRGKENSPPDVKLSESLLGRTQGGARLRADDHMRLSEEIKALGSLAPLIHEGTELPVLSTRKSGQIAASVSNKESNLTLETYREVLNLHSDSILSVLSFFKQNPNYLRQKDWQIAFKNLVFKPGFLIQEYKQTPRLPDILSDFCARNFKVSFDEDRDISTALFFLRVNELFAEFTRGESLEKARVFISTRKAYQKILESLPPSEQERPEVKNLIFRDYIRTFLNSSFKVASPGFSARDLGWYLIAQYYRVRHPLQGADSYEPDEENAIEGFHSLKVEEIRNELVRLRAEKPDLANQIFNQFLRYFAPNESSRMWVPKAQTGPYNYLTRRQDTTEETLIWDAQLDDSSGQSRASVVLTGPTLLLGGRESAHLPRKILDDPLFKAHVNLDERELPLKIGESGYEVLDQDGHRVRFITSGWVPVVQKKWATQWYQWVPDEEVTQKALVFEHKVRVPEKDHWAYLPGYSNWISVRDTNPSTQVANRVKDPAYPSWKVPEEGTVEILAFDKKTKLLYSFARTSDIYSYRQADQSLKVVRVVRGDLSDLTLYPVTDQKSPYQFLKNFEDLRMVWVWVKPSVGGTQGQVLDHIDLPRFGLTLKPTQLADGSEALVCPEIDGYRIAPVQSFSGFEHF